ncbi:MAG: methyltransferase domain-containing protein [Parasphingopyxis sp.]|uniref:methyltransferase domain-containing protein n=1 Tax=Parasphingopyxis sp. TaxID=1920299 RepID=UPI003FA048E0
MNIFQKWLLRRRIMEGSAVVEERIRKRLENFQRQLEMRRDALDEQNKRQEARAREFERRGSGLSKTQLRQEQRAARLDQKSRKLEEKRRKLEKQSAQIDAEIDRLEKLRENLESRGYTESDSRYGSTIFRLSGFDEEQFLSDFDSLLGAERHDEAIDLLIRQLPKMANSRLNRMEKLNHLLFGGRRLQHAGIGKHGWEKLLRKAHTANRAFADRNIARNSTFLDLGCGPHDPVALSAYYYLNGFRRTLACDLQPPRNALFSAYSMYDIVVHMRAFPEKIRMSGTDERLFRERLDDFEIERFAKGDWSGAMAQLSGKIEHYPKNVLELPVDDGELGFAVSFAVLEHVDDADAIMKWLYRKATPGGIQFHFIDMADHRSYDADSDADAWTFLTEEEAPPSMNRLRKSEHLAAIEKAGFRIVSMNETKAEMPRKTAARLIEPWKSMSDEDLLTTKLTVVIQKPE